MNSPVVHHVTHAGRFISLVLFLGALSASATAVTVSGGERVEGDGLAMAELWMRGSLVASASQGAGIELRSGSALAGSSDFTSYVYAKNSCIVGFATDLANLTEESWKTKPIYDVQEQVGFQKGLYLSNVGSTLTIGTNGKLAVYGCNSSSASAALAYIDQTGFHDVSSGDYGSTFLVLTGPISQDYIPIINGAPPVVPVFMRSKDGAAGVHQDLTICLPPLPGVPAGSTRAFLVGSHGETFEMPEWDRSIDDFIPALGQNPPLSERDDFLGAQFAEVWLHSASYRNASGAISINSSIGGTQ